MTDAEVRAIFEAACQASPLGTVEWWLDRLARERAPGHVPVWLGQVGRRFLQEHATRFPPLFTLAPSERLLHHYLHTGTARRKKRKDPEDPTERCHYLLELAMANQPALLPLLRSLEQEEIPDLAGLTAAIESFCTRHGGEVPLEAGDWSRFREAFVTALSLRVVFPATAAGRYCIEGTVYGAAAARRLAGLLLERATPFAGPGGRILVLHGNDPASNLALNAAEAAVLRSGSTSLMEALWEALPDGLKEYRGREKLADVLLCKAAGLGKRRIARRWLARGFVASEAADPLDSALTMVKRVARDAAGLGVHEWDAWEREAQAPDDGAAGQEPKAPPPPSHFPEEAEPGNGEPGDPEADEPPAAPLSRGGDNGAAPRSPGDKPMF